MEVALKKPVGKSSAEDYDVRQLKKVLNRLGLYTPNPKTGMTGIPDAALFNGLKNFQKQNDLRVTERIRPQDETIRKLNAAVQNLPDGHYIWRSVDDDKVRSSHAELNGTLRRWGDSPDPGEEFNCRCWAEPVKGAVPIPPHKPNCRLQKDAHEQAVEKHQLLESKKKNLTEEIERLIKENNDSVEELQKTLGIQIATAILGLPVERFGVFGEVLQRMFGSILSDANLKEADRIGKSLAVIRKKIEYKRRQSELVTAQLDKAKQILEKTHDDLEKCRLHTPNK